ncbi:MAG: VOC family protein [Saprospiraceae bacterium]|nr:VOC family protein [Saprospiraceae bacterium]
MKHFLFLIITSLLYSANSEAQSPSGIQSSFFAIIVEDLDVSSEWYQKILGYEVSKTFISEERGIGQVNLQNEDNNIELIELGSAVNPRNAVPGYSHKTRLTGIFKVGYIVDDFDKWVLHLHRHKAELSGNVVTDPVSDKRMVILLDPDGNRIQIFER